MTKLAELQGHIGDYILGKDIETTLREEVCDDGLAAIDRLQIHRNTYRESLVSALEGIYPLVTVFVGSDFLRQVLKRYVLEHPPYEPMLYTYGSEFPRFLAGLEAVKPMQYIADIAELDWYTHELLQVADEVQDRIVANQYRLTPNIRFVASDAPLFDLWRAAVGQVDADEVDINGEAQSILVLLHEGNILYQPVPDGDVSKFLRALQMGSEDLPELDESALQELTDRGVFLGWAL
ncbi:MAG: putative DNA-binding domain-containing protein [Alphaproteobacteria bacterium]|nr:putative DNA-binding domain-containing protein [Alphaproteobacteria bacterium]